MGPDAAVLTVKWPMVLTRIASVSKSKMDRTMLTRIYFVIGRWSKVRLKLVRNRLTRVRSRPLLGASLSAALRKLRFSWKVGRLINVIFRTVTSVATVA